LSPDALTGMEQNLRFVGAETCDTKIFGRLSAWQNWIFQRPNAVGDEGALTLYGNPNRPEVRLAPDLSGFRRVDRGQVTRRSRPSPCWWRR
jgi:benzoyl-CoA-dihydrodiol lyase